MKLDVWKIFWSASLWSAAFAQISSQIIKIFLPIFKGKKPDFKQFFYYGGIPSAHTAFITAVATSMGLEQGWDSPIFGLAFVVAGILIYDIIKLRKTVEMNEKLVLELSQKEGISEEGKRPQFKGHSPIEVLVGAIWGILWAFIVNWIFVVNHF